jgi:hypothetical protein
MPVQTTCALNMGHHYNVYGSSCWSTQVFYMLTEGWKPRELVVVGEAGGRCERTVCVR